MSADQINIEQVHDDELGIDWITKYKKLEEDFNELEKMRDRWADKATDRLKEINDLRQQLKTVECDLAEAHSIAKNTNRQIEDCQRQLTKLKNLENQNKKLTQQIERARELLKTYNVSFLALLKVSEREADASYLTHQQRKILAEVRFMILQGLGISIESQQKKEAGDTEIDPIPFNSTRPVYDEF